MERKKLLIILGVLILIVVLLINQVRKGKSSKQNLIFQNPLFTHSFAEAGLTELHLAAIQGDSIAIDELLDKGEDINCKSIDGTTPLHLACAFGQAKFAELLVINGADINIVDDGRNTALCLAVMGGQPEIVKLLLTHGASIDTRNKDRKTPLDIALSCKKNMSKANPILKLSFSEYRKNIEECIRILREHEEKN